MCVCVCVCVCDIFICMYVWGDIFTANICMYELTKFFIIYPFFKEIIIYYLFTVTFSR